MVVWNPKQQNAIISGLTNMRQFQEQWCEYIIRQPLADELQQPDLQEAFTQANLSAPTFENFWNGTLVQMPPQPLVMALFSVISKPVSR